MNSRVHNNPLPGGGRPGEPLENTRGKNASASKNWAAKYSLDNFIGNSAEIKGIKKFASRVAQTSATVLITGESGTGKEVLAHSIHNEGSRRNRPFVWVDCSSIPRDLLESELFGYESGSFTGASERGKQGKFELADQGSILLDEIGDMPLDMQVKVLRVLQENEVVRIGGTKPKKVDFRVIATTNRDIDGLVKEDKFRSDLFYRLDVARINIPPLRSRRDDIIVLAQHFLIFFGEKYNKPSIHFSTEVLRSFEAYDWPGNVRELRNRVEKLVILADPNEVITSSGLPSDAGRASMKLRESLREMEREKILEALRKTNNNRLKAAKLLGIHRSGLYQKLKKYGIEKG
jgi:transcriptional regulator with PAS, ATPase and Fis domain